MRLVLASISIGVIFAILILSGRDFYRSWKARKWVEKLMAEQDREIAAHMIRGHNQDCKKYRRNRHG